MTVIHPQRQPDPSSDEEHAKIYFSFSSAVKTPFSTHQTTSHQYKEEVK